eukprot:TRINITY_DN7975_c0_g1_i1.p1 TRINITY_DN7975_c0_g1~~TRINITY_DN7975_c0_g1_i1.p1  ORF type:complete len:344 (+),score=79.86 TRINITY_DN7975_c0_g1_i1:495-1526(+)
MKRRAGLLARVKCEITLAEELWNSQATVKLSAAGTGDIVEVLLADVGTKWWLVKHNHARHSGGSSEGWILRSRLDLIDDGEPLQAPPAIVPSARDLDAWGELVASKLSCIPVVHRNRESDNQTLTQSDDEKLDEFANKADALCSSSSGKHSDSESDMVPELLIDSRLQFVEKMLLNLPGHVVGKKRTKSFKRSISLDPNHRLSEVSSSHSSQRGSVMVIKEDEESGGDDEDHHRSSIMILQSPLESPSRKSLMEEQVDQNRKSALLVPPFPADFSSLEVEKGKKQKSIKPWERKGFQFKEEAMAHPVVGVINPLLIKKKKDSHHAKLQDLFLQPLAEDADKAQ